MGFTPSILVTTEIDQWGSKKGHGFTPETIAEFKKTVSLLRQVRIYVQRIDWLVSGDDGEDSFLTRLRQDLSATMADSKQ